ncbi:MAG: DUF4296 domain-containing protein [Prevotella sp.]|jgi:hypothetical protein
MRSSSALYGMLCLLAVLFATTTLVGCKPGVPDEYIQPDEMEDILYDYHIADGMTSTRPEGNYKDMTQAYHVAVLKKHHVTQSQFDSSMVYYMRNAEILHDIYESLGERMQDEVRNLGGSATMVASQYTANGDTTSIWQGPTFMMLSSKVPFNCHSFTIKVDTTFHAGDMLWLSFRSQFIFQDGMRDGNVVLAIVLKNDSVVTRNLHLSSDVVNTLQISDDNYIGFKEIKGYFQLNTSPNSMTTSTMRMMFLENIQMLRLHRKKPSPVAPGQKSDSTGTNGGTTVPTGQPLPAGASRTSPTPPNLQPLSNKRK